MAISTQDCKNFIVSISHILNVPHSDKWKRVRKYKEGNLVLCDFENQQGRKLTIAENTEDSQLFLYQSQAFTNDIQGRKYIGHPVKEKDLFAFMAECVKKDPSIVYEDPDTLEEAVEPASWTIWHTWTQTIGKYGEIPIDDYYANEEFEEAFADENFELLYNNSELRKEDISRVFWLGMHNYDTAYRIYVFETKDNHLWLGINEPD